MTHTSQTKEVDECKLQIDTKYEMTINFNDKYQFYNKVHERLVHGKDAFEAFTERMKEIGMEYEFFPELSEPMSSQIKFSRLHWHGVIRFPTNISLGLYLLNLTQPLSSIASYQINPYRSEYWPKYITKQRPMMKELFQHYNLSYVVHNNKPQFVPVAKRRN